MDISGVSALLQHLNDEELKDLIKDDGPKIDEMVKEVQQVKSFVFPAIPVIHHLVIVYSWLNGSDSTHIMLEEFHSDPD